VGDAQETKTDPVKFKDGIDETITFQFGFPGGRWLPVYPRTP